MLNFELVLAWPLKFTATKSDNLYRICCMYSSYTRFAKKLFMVVKIHYFHDFF